MTGPLVVGPPVPIAGTGVSLGESPVWDPRTARLRWVDLFDGIVHETDPETGDDTTVAAGGSCGFVALATGGTVRARDNVVVLDDTHGVRDLADLDPSSRLRINDSQVAPGGWLLCGLMALDRADREGTGRLVRVTHEGEQTVVSTGLSVPNGIGWSPDGRTMYHADTTARRVDRLDFDPATGAAENRRTAFETSAFGGMPDGLAVDVDGRIWLAHFGTPFVVCTDDTGREVDRIELPVANVTSCAFGGPDRSTLFVTTSTREATRIHPDAGAVFAVATATRGQEPRLFGAADRAYS
jgi:sugar lactone lactonase YvrE